MTLYELTHAAGDTLLVRALRAVGRSAAAVARFAAAELDRRRTARLLGFEDHELRDIGLTRGDVYAALLTGAGEKASQSLVDRRDERRLAELARLREERRRTEA